MERISSRGGIYYRPHRNRLKPETVQKIIFLYGCYVRDDGGLTHRQLSTFIQHQSISCQINPSKASEEFTKFFMPCVLGFVKEMTRKTRMVRMMMMMKERIRRMLETVTSKNMCVTSIYLKKISYFFIYLLNLSLKNEK